MRLAVQRRWLRVFGFRPCEPSVDGSGSPETPELDLLALRQRLSDAIEDGVNDRFALLFVTFATFDSSSISQPSSRSGFLQTTVTCRFREASTHADEWANA